MFLHHINDGVGGNIIHGETGHRGVAVLLEHQQSVLPRVDLEPLHQLFTLWISDLNIANSNSVSEPEIVIDSFLIGWKISMISDWFTLIKGEFWLFEINILLTSDWLKYKLLSSDGLMLPEPSRQVSESDNVQFSKQQNPHSVVHPALQELINIVTVDSLN